MKLKFSKAPEYLAVNIEEPLRYQKIRPKYPILNSKKPDDCISKPKAYFSPTPRTYLDPDMPAYAPTFMERKEV